MRFFSFFKIIQLATEVEREAETEAGGLAKGYILPNLAVRKDTRIKGEKDKGGEDTGAFVYLTYSIMKMGGDCYFRSPVCTNNLPSLSPCLHVPLWAGL